LSKVLNFLSLEGGVYCGIVELLRWLCLDSVVLVTHTANEQQLFSPTSIAMAYSIQFDKNGECDDLRAHISPISGMGHPAVPRWRQI
jgi:hypothetical protein